MSDVLKQELGVVISNAEPHGFLFKVNVTTYACPEESLEID